MFALRLMLDGLAAALLIFAFSYFWLGNGAHEWAGISLFILLLVHNMFHRRWYAGLSRRTRQGRGIFNTALTLVLLAGMLALCATSLLISETLFPAIRMADDFAARQVHAGVAYWLLLIGAVHLGLRWSLLMAVTAKCLALNNTHAVRTALLRVIALGTAVQGVFSAVALHVPSRLLFQLQMDGWSFDTGAASFFGHCIAVMSLVVCLTFYGARAVDWLLYLDR
jgi:hypothetical protein